ncbi:uncharacterized protein LOC129378683 [Poeciliopsis prolifica]|nr:uncharacterized protein LOC129378683 [Poeciliopsis prolifica]
MQQAYEIATKYATCVSNRGKKGYDKRVYGADLQPGGRVLVRNLSERGGPGKLRSFWEDKVHIITKRRSDISPVYEVVPEGGGKSRVLHRNLLLPCDSLPIDNPEISSKRTKKTKSSTLSCHLCPQEETSDSERDEEMELVCQFPPAQHSGHRAVSLNPDAEPFTPDLHDQDNAPKVKEPQAAWMDNIPEDGSQDVELHQDPPELSVETVSEEEDDPAVSPPTSSYPKRERRRPRMLTYRALGDPNSHEHPHCAAQPLHPDVAETGFPGSWDNIYWSKATAVGLLSYWT